MAKSDPKYKQPFMNIVITILYKQSFLISNLLHLYINILKIDNIFKTSMDKQM